jgi:hypothetical protein
VKDFFERYADRVARGAPDACWEWTGAVAATGYGHTHLKNKHIYAHRAAYESVHGEGSADGWVVRHRCDNPPCCNPAHLQIGTVKDNVGDAWARGRMRVVRGEESGAAKLTDAVVVEMRSLASAGVPVARIRDQLGAHLKHDTVSKAVRGVLWSHLPGAVPNPVRAPYVGSKPGQGAKALAAEKVREIKARLRAGESGARLAREFGVSQATVSAVKVGRIWAHVA